MMNKISKGDVALTARATKKDSNDQEQSPMNYNAVNECHK